MTVEQYISLFQDLDDDKFCDFIITDSNKVLTLEIYSSLYFDSRCMYDNCKSDVKPDHLDIDFRSEIDSEYHDRDALSSSIYTDNHRSILNIFSCNIRT